jgi:hypothetical protein
VHAPDHDILSAREIPAMLGSQVGPEAGDEFGEAPAQKKRA